MICLTNHAGLGVLNGDLGTVTTIDADTGGLPVRLDRDPESVTLPAWYLDDGKVDYGYAITGHKAQGMTVDRTFSIIGSAATRQWVHVAMSRGRNTNIAYLTMSPQPRPERRMRPYSPPRRHPTEAALARIRRSRHHRAAIELV